MFAIVWFMINRLFPLRSEREQVPVQTRVNNRNEWPDQFDADFFAGTVREITEPDLDVYDTPPTSRWKVALPLFGAVALSTALYWGVKAELAAEDRKEKVEKCVKDETGVEVELEINYATGEITRPHALYKPITDCEEQIKKK